MPTRFVTQVIFAPGSKTTIYVTYSGFNENDPGHGGHLFQSTNIGRATPSFTEIDGQNTSSSSSLPDLPTNSVLVTPGNVLFAGADQGVYMSSDGGAHWARVTSGLPHVEVYMLAYDATTKAVVASTHGRGMWSLALGS
jgi:ligand-binding sensor domain-containing protein